MSRRHRLEAFELKARRFDQLRLRSLAQEGNRVTAVFELAGDAKRRRHVPAPFPGHKKEFGHLGYLPSITPLISLLTTASASARSSFLSRRKSFQV